MPITTELMTFTVRAGQEARAEEWMQTLVARQAECVATLDRERMHYECIFRSWRGDRLCLSWLEIKGGQGAHPDTSPHPLDAVHMAFWRECIDPDVPPQTFEPVLSLVPPEVQRVIDARNASLSG